MKERDRELLDKVAAYYLQYADVVSLDDLLKSQRADLETQSVDREALEYVKLYVAYLAVRELLRSAKEALRDRLTYRELSVEYDYEVLGQLDVDRTLLVLPQGLYSYYSYREGANAPEYRVMGEILRSASGKARELLEGYWGKKDLPEYFDFLDDFKRSLDELEEYAKLFPGGYFRPPVYTDPPWLQRAFRAYRVLEERVEVGTGPGGAKGERALELRFILWRLYEVYVFYLLASLLKSEGYRVSKGARGYEATKGPRKLYIYSNMGLEASKLSSVNGSTDVERFRGRPDISLSNGHLVLFECKYSGELGYITLGRFKLMAYAYEYDPTTAVLVYPGLEEGKGYDEEDRATSGLDEIVKKEGYVEFQYNGKRLFMVKVDPLDDDCVNRGRLKRVLEGLI